MENQYYTAGEIARIAGVSLRIIRYYDAKGIRHFWVLFIVSYHRNIVIEIFNKLDSRINPNRIIGTGL